MRGIMSEVVSLLNTPSAAQSPRAHTRRAVRPHAQLRAARRSRAARAREPAAHRQAPSVSADVSPFAHAARLPCRRSLLPPSLHV